jgi:hypothetical protein
MGTWTARLEGMPILVEWPEETRKILGIKDELRTRTVLWRPYTPPWTVTSISSILKQASYARPHQQRRHDQGTASLDRAAIRCSIQAGIPSTEDGKSGAWFRIIDLIQN